MKQKWEKCRNIPNPAIHSHPIFVLKALGLMLDVKIWSSIDISKAKLAWQQWHDTSVSASSGLNCLIASWNGKPCSIVKQSCNTVALEHTLQRAENGVISTNESTTKTSTTSRSTDILRKQVLDGLPNTLNHSNGDSDHDKSKQQLIIEDIRKRKYGIKYDGIIEQIPYDTENEIDFKNRMIENMLSKLSTELYSQSVHFIYEMIQNSNDAEFDNAKILAEKCEKK
jgi:hypothetical protein